MRFYRPIIVTLLFCFVSQILQAQSETIRWYSIQDVEQLSKKEPKKILIDVYAPWCNQCRSMDNAVFSQMHIVRYINSNYYAVKLNGEDTNDIFFKNKTYRFVSQSGVKFNELAAELLRGQLTYPTIVFLDEDLNLIQALQGATESTRFEMIMTYFGDNIHKKMPWTRYERTYQPIKR